MFINNIAANIRKTTFSTKKKAKKTSIDQKKDCEWAILGENGCVVVSFSVILCIVINQF